MSLFPTTLTIRNNLKAIKGNLIVTIHRKSVAPVKTILNPIDPDVSPMNYIALVSLNNIEDYVLVELEKTNKVHSKDFWIKIPESLMKTDCTFESENSGVLKPIKEIIFKGDSGVYFRIPSDLLKWKLKFYFNSKDKSKSKPGGDDGPDNNVSIGTDEP